MRGIELAPDRPVDEVVDLGVSAADAGFDVAFVASHYNNRDPFAVLTRLATATTDIQLGPGVVNPYETHPVALASRAATLQELSDGRAVFGIGAGDRTTLSNLGIDRDRPLAMVAETVRAARELWGGGRVSRTDPFPANDAGLNYTVEPPPVYVGAQGPRMLRLAARVGDGVLVNASHQRDVAWAADQLEAGLADRPTERSELTVAVYAVVSVAEAEAVAREAARPPVAFIVAGAPDSVLERHALDRDRAGQIAELIGAGAFGEAYEAVSAEMLDAFAVAGTPSAVAERFTALLEHADGIVAGSPLGPDPMDAIELIDRAFQSAGV